MNTKQSFFHVTSVIKLRLLGAAEALSFVLILSSFIFYLSSCQRSTAPVYNPQKLQLTVVDVSCTEAWLQLKTEQTEKAENEKDLVLQVFRNDSLVVNKNWGAGDSLVYLDGLQPNTSYAFSAKLLRDNKLLAASPKVTATTMDTTSHNFTWQTFEFGGQGGSSSFYDVAIIDENDIWAVGEIYTADDKYNAAHWNGEKWELKKVPYRDEKGYVWITPLYSIFAFSSNDIWFEGGIHWNGSRFVSLKKNISFPSHVNKIWGTSDNDLYIVGNGGLIAHYDGKTWQRIKSGTNLPVQDIWGAVDQKTGNYEILCVASKTDNGNYSQIFNINHKKAIKINSFGLPWSMKSIWFIPKRKYYASGDGLYIKYNLKNNWTEYVNFLPIYEDCIRGQNFNDIVISGSNGLLSHFNGINWHHYLYRELSEIWGHYYSSSIKGNIICAVGESSMKAIVVIGKRK